MTLYLKYRPQKVSELDLTLVRESLGKILSSKNIPHAFLFAGPKGTGKTSSARILAKALNCEHPKEGEPCNECDQCKAITNGSNIDVIEMDAASNRGIDDIRILRENIKLAPARAKYKIYIIDEAHMLTTEAANALLKTLEEPPAHVIFILATTNPEKLPQTIHSRLTVINFNKASLAEISEKLSKIAKGENYQIDPEALDLIARASDGSFRDAVKNLELLSIQSSQLTIELVKQVLYQSDTANPENLVILLDQKLLQESIDEIEKTAAKGANMRLYLDQLISIYHLRLLNAVKNEEDISDISKFLELLNFAKHDFAVSPIPQVPLELAVLKFLGQIPKQEQAVKKDEPPAPDLTTSKIEEKAQEIEVKILEGKLPEHWDELLHTMRDKNASIEALLRASKPLNFDGKTLTLGVYYKFHKERLEVGTNRVTLEQTLAAIYGNNIKVDCVLTQKPISTRDESTQGGPVLEEPQKNIVDAAKEIFG